MTIDDDYFGGPARPDDSAASYSGGYGEFSLLGAVQPATRSRSRAGLIAVLGITGLVLALTMLIGYMVATSGTDIVLPDRLLGFERVVPEAGVEQEIERSLSQSTAIDGENVELHFGTYLTGQKGLLVIAVEIADKGRAWEDSFFVGAAGALAQQETGTVLTEVDAGSASGRMQCADIATAGFATGICAWIADDTLGIVAITDPESDVVEVTRQVRETIEQ